MVELISKIETYVRHAGRLMWCGQTDTDEQRSEAVEISSVATSREVVVETERSE